MGNSAPSSLHKTPLPPLQFTRTYPSHLLNQIRAILRETKKMSTVSGDQRNPRPENAGGAPAETEHLPCPRCHSTNTKFCYYNNYNLSQPRYFCKSCRRYWTQGGTLRNIPVGGGSRRNAKRSRTCVTEDAKRTIPNNTAPIFNNISNKDGEVSAVPFSTVSGSFTSLLNSQGSSGFWTVGNELGLEEIGGLFGQRRGGGAWPWMDFGENFGGSWQIGGCVDGAFGDGDHNCISWPELAISASSEGLN